MYVEEITPLWTGELEAIQEITKNQWHDEGDVADPAIHIIGRVGVVILDGLLRQNDWDQLNTEIIMANIDPEIEVLLLAINSRGQEWLGASKVIESLLEARGGVLTCAFIHCAQGLAVPLAASCQIVFAHGMAQIGNLQGHYPFGNPQGWPPLDSTNDTIADFLLSSDHRITAQTVQRISSGTITGEEAEARNLVNFIHPRFDFTTEYLNTIGTKK